MTRIVLFLFIFSTLSQLFSQEKINGMEVLPGTKIKEHVGEVLPVGLPFVADNGQTIRFSQALKGPTVMNFVYYRCPGICSPLLTSMVKLFNETSLEPGKDFFAVTLSFDETENAQLAAEKKENYFKMIKREFPRDAWTWLAGEGEDIRRITDAAGFEFVASAKDFIHPAAMYIISKEGRIVRYFSGITFDPFSFRMAILEASQPESLSMQDKLMLFLYKYDADLEVYAFNQTAIWGGVALITLILILSILRSVSANRKTAASAA